MTNKAIVISWDAVKGVGKAGAPQLAPLAKALTKGGGKACR